MGMRVFAIADLHLPGQSDKPMDVFGSRWENHQERICDAWQQRIAGNDCVLIPGDISWAMRLEDAIEDLNTISKLNGTKIILRGNHDYWWSSPSKLRAILPDGMLLIQNDSVDMQTFSVAGTRGWLLPTAAGFCENDEKIYRREQLRLELSLKSVKSLPIIVMMHYPPVGEQGLPNGFTEIIDRYDVSHVAYGHLHSQSCVNAFEGTLNGKQYCLCSSDYLNFEPRLIAEL